MRHHNPDKPDSAADRDRGTGCRRDDQDRGPLQPLHRDADMTGGGLAQGQPVQAARQQCRDRQRQQDQGNRRREPAPGRPGQRAHVPEGEITQLRVIRHVDKQPSQSHRQGGERDPCKKHRATEVRPCRVAMP